MAKVTDLTSCLDELRALLPGFPSLRLSEAWSIPKNWEVIGSEEWKNLPSFPNASQPGVYVFTDADGNILYIGKASVGGLGQRIGNGYIGRRGLKTKKISGACALQTIPLDRSHFFLAPSIEEFLIDRLDPYRNTIGRSRNGM